MRHCIVLVGLAIFLVSTGTMADAKEHFRAGQSYYTQGRYEKAIEEFKEAYRLDPKPLLLFNIAQSHEKLGNLKEAVSYLEQFLEKDPETDQKKMLHDKIRNLKSRIKATGITVKCNEAGASIIVDNVEMAATPLKGVIPLDTGTHKVTIRKAGFQDFVMNIAVSGGRSVPIEAVLEKDPSGATPVSSGGDPVIQMSTDDESSGGGMMNVLPWIVTGVGAATFGVGLFGIAMPAVADEDKPKAQLGDVIWISGAVIGAGGLTWAIINIVQGNKDERAAAVVPFADRHTAGLSASFTF